MHSPIILVTLLALGLTTALPHNNRRQATIPTAVDITCAQAVILAQAIALNVADQQQELATVNTMAALLQANPIDTAAWAQSRTALLQFVNNGIAIRQANQLITPAQNPSTAGVATVASAQLTELALATNLTMMGADNVPGNSAIVRTLQQNFAGGIQQNNRNMADVSTHTPLSLLLLLVKHTVPMSFDARLLRLWQAVDLSLPFPCQHQPHPQRPRLERLRLHQQLPLPLRKTHRAQRRPSPRHQPQQRERTWLAVLLARLLSGMPRREERLVLDLFEERAVRTPCSPVRWSCE